MTNTDKDTTMNDTKIKPAKPLPWKSSVGSLTPARIISGAFVVAAPSDEQDAEYIAHACNAYPRLLASLKTARDLLADLYPAAVDHHRHAAAISELLKSIGEGE